MRKEQKMKDSQRRWRPGFLALALALVIGALVLAGCGGGGSSSSSESGSNTTASSSGSGSESSSSGGSESETNKGGMFDISSEAKACLKEKGVELPEFKGGGEGGEPPSGEKPEGMPEGGEKPEGGEMPAGGPPGGEGGEGSEKFEEQKEAFEECGVELGAGPGGEGGKPSMNSAAFKKQVKEYVACVRENGYEIAEPNFSGEGPVFEKSESESAAFKKASKSCESLLKGGGSGSASGEAESGGEG
jgi:hypothetical protein